MVAELVFKLSPNALSLVLKCTNKFHASYLHFVHINHQIEKHFIKIEPTINPVQVMKVRPAPNQRPTAWLLEIFMCPLKI